MSGPYKKRHQREPQATINEAEMRAIPTWPRTKIRSHFFLSMRMFLIAGKVQTFRCEKKTPQCKASTQSRIVPSDVVYFCIDHVARKLVCVAFLVSHLSNCDLCGCSVGLVIKSADIWHGVRPQQRPEAHDGGALASEAGDMWESCGCSSSHSCSVALPQVKPDGVEQAAPPGVVHIDVAPAWRSEEAACKDFSCKTHISLSSWASRLVFPFRSANDLHPILSRAVSLISIALVCVSVTHCWYESS